MSDCIKVTFGDSTGPSNPNTTTTVDDGTFQLDQGATINIDALVNDSDAEGDTQTITDLGGTAVTPGDGVLVNIIVGGTLIGTATLLADGTVDFTADASAPAGTYSFPYTVTDSGSPAANSTSNITVEILEAGCADCTITYATASGGAWTYNGRSYVVDCAEAYYVIGYEAGSCSEGSITSASITHPDTTVTDISGMIVGGVLQFDPTGFTTGTYTITIQNSVGCPEHSFDVDFAADCIPACTDCAVSTFVASGGGGAWKPPHNVSCGELYGIAFGTGSCAEGSMTSATLTYPDTSVVDISGMISGGALTFDPTGLTAGAYTITIQNSVGCPEYTLDINVPVDC